ncbi:creatininase [Kocuria flava]|uniref:Creatininase n=1 Tax=Kocuria flava TaxID=446860 RepID=A0A0U3HN00_9MICC|nr:creatininase [Kocuria flava]ALU38966.1 creatininase [Kocuria flava]GEO91175.1 creatininase [Kocuria flava]
MVSTRHLEDLDAASYEEYASTGHGLVLVPTGATEQHGPHMPLGVDAMLSTAVCAAVADDLDAVVAPAFRYGYKSQPRSGGGNHRVGTTSLSGQVLILQTRDVVSEFFRHGIRRVVVVNGHFENYQFLYEGLDLAVREHRDDDGGPVRALLLSYWDFVDEQTLEAVFPDGFLGWDIEHGGVLETSLMLHLHPGKVDMSRAPVHPPAELTPYDVFPEDPARTPGSGCLSSPAGATAERGELLLNAVRAGIARAVSSEFGK